MSANLSRELANLKPYVPLCDASAADIKRLGAEAEVKDTIEELSPDLLAMVRQAQEKNTRNISKTFLTASNLLSNTLVCRHNGN